MIAVILICRDLTFYYRNTSPITDFAVQNSPSCCRDSHFFWLPASLLSTLLFFRRLAFSQSTMELNLVGTWAARPLLAVCFLEELPESADARRMTSEWIASQGSKEEQLKGIQDILDLAEGPRRVGQ